MQWDLLPAPTASETAGVLLWDVASSMMQVSAGRSGGCPKLTSAESPWPLAAESSSLDALY